MYTKLFQTIIHSTIWREPPEVCKVWVTMMAICNKYGVVEASIPGLADAARVPIETVEMALESFLAPDRYSRTKDHEGRRIKEVDGGWLLLNHGKYRDKLDADDRRAKNAAYQRESRARRKAAAGVNVSAPVSNGQRLYDESAKSAYAAPATDTDINTGGVAGAPPPPSEPKAKTKKFVPPTLEEVRAYLAERRSSVDPDVFWNHYEANGWKQASGRPIVKWRSAVVTWERRPAGMNGNGRPVQSAPKTSELYPALRPAR